MRRSNEMCLFCSGKVHPWINFNYENVAPIWLNLFGYVTKIMVASLAALTNILAKIVRLTKQHNHLVDYIKKLVSISFSYNLSPVGLPLYRKLDIFVVIRQGIEHSHSVLKLNLSDLLTRWITLNSKRITNKWLIVQNKKSQANRTSPALTIIPPNKSIPLPCLSHKLSYFIKG